jgi:hypothetical protein
MVGVTGFEPATPASRTQCSTMLSHTPDLYQRIVRPKGVARGIICIASRDCQGEQVRQWGTGLID